MWRGRPRRLATRWNGPRTGAPAAGPPTGWPRARPAAQAARARRAGRQPPTASCRDARQCSHASRSSIAASRPAPSQPNALPAASRPPAHAMAAISTPLTTRLAEYMPVKSRSCCSRVVQRLASSAAGNATALQIMAPDAAGRMAAGSPPASHASAGSRSTISSNASAVAPASRPCATRRWVAATTGGRLPGPGRDQHVREGAAGQHAGQPVGQVSISTTTSARPEVPKAAACADSRASPSSRLASSRARDRAPALRNMGRIIECAPGAAQQKLKCMVWPVPPAFPSPSCPTLIPPPRPRLPLTKTS